MTEQAKIDAALKYIGTRHTNIFSSGIDTSPTVSYEDDHWVLQFGPVVHNVSDEQLQRLGSMIIKVHAELDNIDELCELAWKEWISELPFII